MRCRPFARGLVPALAVLAIGGAPAQSGNATSAPRTWDDQAISALEILLANPVGSPKHVSAEYYYGIPVAPIYKSFPVYAPGREPTGYWEWLKQQEPEILWDDGRHRPVLDTPSDWIQAGEIVFDASVSQAPMSVENIRDPAWYAATQWPATRNGTVPIARYVVKRKGDISLEMFSCATCHTRVMPDVSIVKGAQGNFSLGRPNALRLRDESRRGGDSRFWNQLRLTIRATTSVPWLTPDPELRIDRMSPEEFANVLDAIPPGVNPRHRASPLNPVQIPDLIGISDRRYLDRTGLQPHRSIADLMRYDAMNRGILNGGDGVANHGGFIPGDPRGSSNCRIPAH